MKNIKRYTSTLAISLISVLAISFSFIPASVAYASCTDSLQASATCGFTKATGGSASGTSLDNVIHAIVTILSIIVGIAAIIMIIISGFKYITSGGDSGKVSSAKNTLVYALVGVAVAALSELLVKLVLNRAGGK